MPNVDRESVFSLASPEAAPACLARGHSRWLRFCLDRRYSSTSLPPLAPSPLRDFSATTEALTPVRPALRSLHEHRLFGEQVSLIHVSDLPIPPSPTTPQALDTDFARYPSSRRVSHSRGSRLHLSYAGSPTLTGRIEFVILRMDRSPPVAPHPASRRRSYSWLQAGERIPEEDSHLSDQTRFQAHAGGSPSRILPVSLPLSATVRCSSQRGRTPGLELPGSQQTSSGSTEVSRPRSSCLTSLVRPW